MPSSISEPLRSTPRKSLDGVEPRTVKAGLVSQAQSIRMSAVVRDALIDHYGSLKSAAISMGQMDQGQLTRELDSGKFKFERLELCDDEAKAFVSAALHQAFVKADEPRVIARRALRTVRDALALLEQYVEFVA